MEALLKILKDLHPEVDYETCDTLVDDEILDPDDLERLADVISGVFDVQIPEEEINAENFNSAETIYDLIESLENED